MAETKKLSVEAALNKIRAEDTPKTRSERRDEEMDVLDEEIKRMRAQRQRLERRQRKSRIDQAGDRSDQNGSRHSPGLCPSHHGRPGTCGRTLYRNGGESGRQGQERNRPLTIADKQLLGREPRQVPRSVARICRNR